MFKRYRKKERKRMYVGTRQNEKTYNTLSKQLIDFQRIGVVFIEKEG